MTLALLFPGQGTQHPAMLGWLDAQPEARSMLDRMAARLDHDWRSRLDDADWATRNHNAQVLLTGLCVATWQCLVARLPSPSVIAGYSVGELPAFAVAGVFDGTSALDLAEHRAAAMEQSVAGRDTGLLAVAGVGDAAVAAACARHDLAIAIEIAADRRVLGGLAQALDAAAHELAREGARCQRLAVRVASHTPWMAAAATDFAAHVRAVPFARPHATLVCDLTGAPTRDETTLRTALAGQLARPVRWAQSMDSIVERRPRCVLEIGPGSTLARLWNEFHPDIPARSVDEFRGPAAVGAWVSAALAGR
ncbi:MAG: malonate decarboxylase subunit epsilon [Casimicrobiaceae bacterium]